jgi:hypothetical protein
MRGTVLTLYIFSFSFWVSAQTNSDSLYFAKLYPLDSGEFMVIGSEVPGSFRKTVIRIYDKNLKIKKQIYDKNMRNSEIFLDHIYPNYFRIVSRYRWNKGRVMLHGKDLGLESVKYFKRDQYKDWKNTDDEPGGYPLLGNEKFLGQQSIFYKDSFCYYFSKEAKTVYVSIYDPSAIKPIYIPKSSHLIKDVGLVESFKFVLTDDNRVLFYYGLKHKENRSNYFAFLDKVNSDTDLNGISLTDDKDNYLYYISDINYDSKSKMIFFGGSILSKSSVLKPNANTALKQSMSGYFLKVFLFDKEENELNLVVDQMELNSLEDEGKVMGYRLSKMGIEKNNLYAVFEKYFIEERKVDIKEGLGLSGSYFTYTSLGMNIVYSDFKTPTIHLLELPLKFNLSNEKYLEDKHWRTLHQLKGQGNYSLLFNGLFTYGNNDLCINNVDLNAKNTVYSDRNYNYYLCDWSGDEPKYSLIYKNNEKARCYFYNDYYVKFMATEWGFKLEKVKY